MAKAVSFSGIGLHSGREVSVTLNPAPSGTGIVFVRTDLPGAPRVKACCSNVTQTLRATTLSDGPARVMTVEHLLAALFVSGIDNCLIEIDAGEPPVGDGSALPYVELVRQAGKIELPEPRVVRDISAPLAVYDGDRFIAVMPYEGLRITFVSVNPHPLLGVQLADIVITPETFAAEIAPARTVGFLSEYEALKAQGLALGGSLDNAVIYDDTGVLTPLRFPDELVRHKVLDCIGDFSLGGAFNGHVMAVKSGHALNTALVKKIWQSCP